VWFLFHRKTGTKAVSGGRVLTERCPTCKRTTRFHEVEVSEKLGVWFVDVIGDSERAFRCGECGDTFDLRDHSPAKPAPAPTKTGMDRVEQMAAEQRRRDAAGKAKAAAISTRIDDELAELKKRMGKG
jgi:transposase-like protein